MLAKDNEVHSSCLFCYKNNHRYCKVIHYLEGLNRENMYQCIRESHSGTLAGYSQGK
jgi:hypothetical protein